PFDWLLPRSAALVYHGGVGTILESLRAGVPFVCVAYHAEHRMWGARLQELGAGPGFVPREALTARSLTEAMNVALTDEGIRRREALRVEQVGALPVARGMVHGVRAHGHDRSRRDGAARDLVVGHRSPADDPRRRQHAQ